MQTAAAVSLNWIKTRDPILKSRASSNGLRATEEVCSASVACGRGSLLSAKTGRSAVTDFPQTLATAEYKRRLT